MNIIQIDHRFIGPKQPVFIIAEIGINHNGSLDLALELIEKCHSIGCDAVKFQKRTVPVVYKGQLDAPRDVHESIIDNAMARRVIEDIEHMVFPAESILRLEQNKKNTTNGDLKFALEFGLKEYDIIDRLCNELGILWSASAWDGLSAHFINGFNVQWLKIASACLTNSDLLRRVAKKGKPVILSVGGSTMEQVHKAIKVLRSEVRSLPIILLHCVSSYPTADEDANISMIKALQRQFNDIPIGYSGHEADDFATLLAVDCGSCVIERHVTLDKNLPGSDHKVSLSVDEFAELIKKIRHLEHKPEDFYSIIGEENNSRLGIVLGDGIKKVLPAEKQVMQKLRRVDDLEVCD